MMPDETWTGPLPTLHDVYRARRVIAPHLPRTPLIHAPALDRLLGAQVFVKCENLLPTGAFKVRGGITLMSALSPEERRRGVITASTGNHGQSIAYAGHMLGVRVVIGAPRESNPLKVSAMRALGAEVVLEGRDFDEAREWVERTARAEGYRYVHSANEPLLIAGVGTSGLDEIVLVSDEELKDAILLLAEAVRQTAEGAGAASTAAALRLGDRLRGRKVALVLSGGNITLETLAGIYRDEARIRRVAERLRARPEERTAGAPPSGEPKAPAARTGR